MTGGASEILEQAHWCLRVTVGLGPPESSAFRGYRQLPRSYLYFGFTVVVDLNVVDRPRVDSIRSAAVGPAVFDCGNALVLANGYPMADRRPGGVERHLPLLLHANSLTAHRFAAAIPVDAVVHGLWNWDGAHAGDGLPVEVRQVLDDERQAGIAAMATLRVMGGLADLFSPAFLDDPHLGQVLPAELLAWYHGDGRWFARDLRRDFDGLPDERIRRILDAGKDCGGAAIKAFAASGGRLLFGSDTPSGPTYANPPGYNGYLEMLALERVGIPPRQILAAATSATAKFFALAADYGTIEPGKRASLLLLRADPQRSVTAFDTIELVIQGERALPRSALRCAPLRPRLLALSGSSAESVTLASPSRGPPRRRARESSRRRARRWGPRAGGQ